MTKRLVPLVPLIATAGALASAGALGFAGTAAAAGALPTITVALKGVNGVTVSGTEVSGAVSVTATFAGKVPGGPNNSPAFGLVRLNPGMTIQQAAGAVNSHGGDINALTPYGKLFVSAAAPGTVQTVLTPGNYVALNVTGSGQPGFAPFTVTQSPSPAALPPAAATQTAIEFAFRGPSCCTMGRPCEPEQRLARAYDRPHPGPSCGDRCRGDGTAAGGQGQPGLQAPGPNPAFVTLLGPASPGAMQQQVLHAVPGYYVEVCFMDTQDGREHTQLGMLRLIRIV